MIYSQSFSLMGLWHSKSLMHIPIFNLIHGSTNPQSIQHSELDTSKDGRQLTVIRRMLDDVEQGFIDIGKEQLHSWVQLLKSLNLLVEGLVEQYCKLILSVGAMSQGTSSESFLRWHTTYRRNAYDTNFLCACLKQFLRCQNYYVVKVQASQMYCIIFQSLINQTSGMFMLFAQSKQGVYRDFPGYQKRIKQHVNAKPL